MIVLSYLALGAVIFCCVMNVNPKLGAWFEARWLALWYHICLKHRCFKYNEESILWDKWICRHCRREAKERRALLRDKKELERGLREDWALARLKDLR